MATRPKIGVVSGMLDGLAGHIQEIELARVQLVRAANGVLTNLRAFDDALRVIDSHGENAQCILDELRVLRPTVQGRRTDLKRVA